MIIYSGHEIHQTGEVAVRLDNELPTVSIGPGSYPSPSVNAA